MNGDPKLERIAKGNALALCATGTWTASFAPVLERMVADAEKLAGGPQSIFIDVSEVSKLDTFGAWLIERLRRSLTQGAVEAQIAGLSANYSSLVDEVRRVRATPVIDTSTITITGMLEQIGQTVAGVAGTVAGLIDMLGAVLAAGARTLIHPRSFRLTSTVHHLEQVCWRAVPIVVLITFLIGCIIAQQGIFHFRRFGADIFVVDMLGVLVLREIGVLLVAIMVAGRSGSAYTAELGSMKMREEIDALRTMGFDPIEVLVLPRMLAAGAGAADPGLPRRDGRTLWRWSCRLALRRRRSRSLPAAPARRHLDRPFHRRHRQGAGDGCGDRHRCLRRGPRRAGQCGIARPAHDRVGGEGHFLRHRHGRRVRHLLRLDRDVRMAGEIQNPIIRVRDITVQFGATRVLDGLDLDVKRGEILGFVGPSGAGKSVLTRTIIGLVPKVAGSIEVFGVDLDASNTSQRRNVERRWGVLFQQGALFSSLTVRQNIQFPMREYLRVSQRLMDEITIAKLTMVGLKPEVADRFPSELSGGMIKRVALARALSLDPDLVFLDEPTSGLDPIGAGDFDELVRTLQRTLGLTVFMVTHDLDSLYTACDRIAVLGNGKIIAAGSIADMQASQHPWLRQYFHGKRARAVMG
ncbi:ABC-type transporter Mla maintaining outer membrane lipid asymmetry ATPase subunit MlaF [Bradyrhizobium sp. GM7.3]